MDLFGEGSSWAIIIPIIILVVLSIVMRRRRPAEKTESEIVGSLFMDVSENLRLMEKFSYQRRPKKFRTDSWKRNSEKISFLSETLQNTLSQAFNLAEDFNQQIDAAKKQRANIYLTGVDAHKLEAPLTKSKEGLEQWIRANMSLETTGRRGCMGA
jgi:CRISPR/Cas system-associated protein Cas10 (large subunit of type III CRISPR-Cas system)